MTGPYFSFEVFFLSVCANFSRLTAVKTQLVDIMHIRVKFCSSTASLSVNFVSKKVFQSDLFGNLELKGVFLFSANVVQKSSSQGFALQESFF